MLLQDQVLATLRERAAGLIIGTIFVFIGLAAFGMAAVRRRIGIRVFIWLGIWSAIYGARPLLDPLADMGLLPHWFQASVPYLDTIISYSVLVFGTLTALELSIGRFRIWLWLVVTLSVAIGLVGIGIFLFTGENDRLMPYNNLLAAGSLLVVLIVVLVPGLSSKSLVLPPLNRRVLAIGTVLFVMEALYVNLTRPLGYQTSFIWDALGFAVLLFSLGYAAMDMIFARERRLQSIERELEIAREIQTSILPGGNPEIENLRIAAACHPMTEVAGDFYEFIPVDEHRVGVLIADVSGHGVPAALIAAMLKVAVQSVVPCAQNPQAVLAGLNRMLSGQAKDQFVTAAYLFLDTQNYRALYSAAGHPPLFLSRAGTLQRIESNGLVFGVTAQPDYPVHDLVICPGDRLLLYTDGVIEPENARGKPFGDSRLEQVVLGAQTCSPSELTERLLTEIHAWQPASLAQQDDITLIIIDVS